MSTTEESDWEASGPGIRVRSEPPLPGPQPPAIPILAGDTASLGRRQSLAVGEMMRTLVSTETAREGEFDEEIAPSGGVIPIESGSHPAPSDPSMSNVQCVADTHASQDREGHNVTGSLLSKDAKSAEPNIDPQPSSMSTALDQFLMDNHPAQDMMRSQMTTTEPAIDPQPSSMSTAVEQYVMDNYPAQDMMLSQRTTSQNIDATPSQRAFMAQVSGGSSRGGRGSHGGRGSRGGRPPKIRIEPPREEGDPATAPPRKVNRGGRPRGSRAAHSTVSSARGVGRGGRPRSSRAGLSPSTGRGGIGRGGTGTKRKRKSGSEDDDGDSDSSEEITALPSQSRSGRRITQVVTPVPIGSELGSSLKPSTKQTSFAIPFDPSSSAMKPAKRKRVALSAVCKNCGRGHSPPGNQIVFCDGCNTPWHQYCHDRPITPTVIQEEEKEWHCSDCQVQTEEAGYLIGRIAPANGMGLAEKRRALEGMEKAELVALLLRASALYSDLPIFKPPPPPDTWTAAATAATTPQGAVAKGEAEYEYYDEPLPYPKTGNGVRLPPEADALALLIDDDTTTYSHSWKDGGAWGGAMGKAGVKLGLSAPSNVAVGVGA